MHILPKDRFLFCNFVDNKKKRFPFYWLLLRYTLQIWNVKSKSQWKLNNVYVLQMREKQ